LSKLDSDDVWICGAGIVSSLGLDIEAVGQQLEQSASGLGIQDQFEGEIFGSPMCAAVQSFKANAYVKNRKNLKLMSRSVRLGMGAIRLATDTAPHVLEEVDPDRLGVVVGAGLALGRSKDLVAGIKQSFVDGHFNNNRFGEVGMRAINPLWLLKGLSNNVLGFATAELDARGFNQNYCNSGISGLQAVGEAFWALREDRADVLVAGGSDCAIDPFHFAGFSRLKALSSAQQPSEARSFDCQRDGFVLGEGAAYFVMQRTIDDHAKYQRLAKVLGVCTMTCSQNPLGGQPEIIKACIERCCQQAGIDLQDIGAIIAHGNGSKRFDRVEAQGIEAAFGKYCPPVTTNKPQLGHTIAASGPLSIACALHAGRVGRLPAIANLTEVDPECSGIDLVTGEPRSISTSKILVMSAGLGGQVSCLIIEVIK
jgi:3-oxoacyl-[acyl-carrier-protein] synthase II